jgi:hypothetical protein
MILDWLFRKKKSIPHPDRFQNGVFGPLMVEDKEDGEQRVATDDEYQFLLEEK